MKTQFPSSRIEDHTPWDDLALVHLEEWRELSAREQFAYADRAEFARTLVDAAFIAHISLFFRTLSSYKRWCLQQANLFRFEYGKECHGVIEDLESDHQMLHNLEEAIFLEQEGRIDDLLDEAAITAKYTYRERTEGLDYQTFIDALTTPHNPAVCC